MSRALARLREVLGDVLLIRAPGGGYALSPRAEALAGQLAGALDQVKAVFQPPVFDPAQVERTIRIVGLDTHTHPAGAGADGAAGGRGARDRCENRELWRRHDPAGGDGAARSCFRHPTTPLPPGARSETYAQRSLALVMRKGSSDGEKEVDDRGLWPLGSGRHLDPGRCRIRHGRAARARLAYSGAWRW
jgi:hypothetical protein